MDDATPGLIKQQLHRFGMESTRLHAAICRVAGIAGSELDALEHLEADGPLTQRELGDRLMLSSGGVTMLVDRLERAGWVQRRSHPSDRRAVIVEPTKKAFAQVPKALVNFHAAIERAASEIPSEHREALGAFLVTVSSAASEAVSALLRAPSK